MFIHISLLVLVCIHVSACQTVYDIIDSDKKQEVTYLNVTTVYNHNAVLPCFVQSNRKFIWMHTDRDEIISIAQTIINGDNRLRIESDCYDSEASETLKRHGVHQGRSIDEFVYKYANLKRKRRQDMKPNRSVDGCWRNLQIKKVQLEDEGFYICQIDTMSSARVYLNVLMPPYLNKNPHEFDTINLKKSSLSTSLSFHEGSDVNLACNAVGRPAPTIRWYLNKSEVSKPILLTESSVLHLKNITRHSHKKYECVADNGVKPSLSRTFTLNILFKPTLRKLEIKNHCHEKRQNLIVGCQVSGNPAPIIIWFVNGTKLEQNERKIQHATPHISSRFKYKINEIKGIHSNIFSKLEIQSYAKSDLDLKYECYAENYLGTEMIDVDICSKNTFDTKEYYYWRNSKKDIYISPQIVLKIDPNDTAYYSRYVNLTEKAKAEALEEERWRALKAGSSSVFTSSISIIALTYCAAAAAALLA